MPPSHPQTILAANATLLDGRDLAAADRFFAPGYVAHGTGRDLTGGPDAVRRYGALLHAAFPDLAAAVDILAEAGDRIAWQRECNGTQEGALLGFPATGRRVAWRDMVVSRFEGDLIAEEWVVTDLGERLLRARQAPSGEEP